MKTSVSLMKKITLIALLGAALVAPVLAQPGPGMGSGPGMQNSAPGQGMGPGMGGMGGMRGGRDKPTSHAGEHMHDTGAPTSKTPDDRDVRLAELEREVAELRAAQGRAHVRRP